MALSTSPQLAPKIKDPPLPLHQVAVYTMLVVLVVAMVSVTGLCYMKAGMELGGVTADSLMADIQNQTGLGSDALTINDPTLASMIAVETGDTWLYEAGFWIMAVLTVVTVVLVFLWRKQLRMAIAIVQEACAVFRTMPSLMLFPFSTVLLVVGLCVFFLLGAFLLVTSKPEAFADKIAQLNATLTTLGDGELMTEYAAYLPQPLLPAAALRVLVHPTCTTSLPGTRRARTRRRRRRSPTTQ